MNDEQIETIRKILYMIIISISRDYYDTHISGLTSNDYDECIELLKTLKKEKEE